MAWSCHCFAAFIVLYYTVGLIKIDQLTREGKGYNKFFSSG